MSTTEAVRSTVYLDPELHQALRLKSAHSQRSMSDIVNEALRGIEPMAWDFVMNFARDNQLQLGEVCALPEPAAPAQK